MSERRPPQSSTSSDELWPELPWTEWAATISTLHMWTHYTYPEPAGIRSAPIRPAEAFFDAGFGDFILPYDAVRSSRDPDAAVLEFLESTYAAGADLSGWDTPMLEPAVDPDRPPRRAWSRL